MFKPVFLSRDLSHEVILVNDSYLFVPPFRRVLSVLEVSHFRCTKGEQSGVESLIKHQHAHELGGRPTETVPRQPHLVVGKLFFQYLDASDHLFRNRLHPFQEAFVDLDSLSWIFKVNLPKLQICVPVCNVCRSTKANEN